jgi:pilus assembly protein Flp/PilA
LQLINSVFANLIARLMPAGEKDEEGQTLVEYGLIIALLSIVCIGVLALVGDELIVVFNTIKNELAAATP